MELHNFLWVLHQLFRFQFSWVVGCRQLRTPNSEPSPHYGCNTPDVIYLICTPTLAVSGTKLFYFLGFGFLSPCVVVVVMHLISCHHVHCICIRVRLIHPSIFPVVHFAFRRSILLRWSFLPFFHVWGLNISGLDRDLPSGLGLLPVDRLSSFVPFGLRLMLQRLTG